ncbi:MAG: phytoene desaturase family protein [Candidatus Binatia bacterium]
MSRWDVIVIGAGLGGMLTGAILARRGRRVLVLERELQPGGRLRSYDVDGFVVDCGAFLWPNKFLDQALAAAGATSFIGSEIPASEVMRIYVQGLGGKRFSFPWLGRGATDLADTIREVYRASNDDFQAFAALLGQLAQWNDAEVTKLLPVRVGDWLAANVSNSAVANAVKRTLMLFGTYEPENASVGEFARLLQRNRTGDKQPKPESCGANSIGGVRALVEAIRAALDRNGAELRLGTTVDQIAVAGGRAAGVLVHGASPFQEQLTADVVVSNLPIWTLFGIIAERHFPAEFVANARQYAKVGGTVGVAYAFDDVPLLRQTGEPDWFPGWTRLLVGPERTFGGGFFWMSHHSPHNAPPGKHILQGMRLVPPFTLTDQQQINQIVTDFDTLAREIYSNLDRTLRWRRCWITRDGTEYMISAVPKPDVRAPSVANLYFVGETINLPSIQMDAAAHSALECVRLLEESK